ncbi:MAG: VenA family class IV lanthipeptide [Actinomycetota bacterium]|nr:VenA family class IV lanthipeptide [Actinomycetota bacterium]
MQLDNFDLVASLQALPETNPIEIDGIQLGGRTCVAACVGVLTVNVPTVCVGITCQ